MAKVQVIEKEWLDTAAALRALGRSERSLQRLATAGHVRFEVRAGTRERVYHAGDIARVKESGIKTEREPGKTDQALATMPDTTDLRAWIGEQIAAAMRRLPAIAPGEGEAAAPVAASPVAASPVALSEKLWLSTDEAVAYSGLARQDVIRLRKEGRVIARRSGGWKIQRASLERASLEAFS